MTILPWLELRELGPAAYGELVRQRVGDGPGVLHVRRRLRRPGVLPGHGHARGGRADARPRRSTTCAPCAACDFRALRRRRGRAAVRRARPGHGAARRQRGLRDALADRAAARLRHPSASGTSRPDSHHMPSASSVADDQVGHVVLAEVDDRELLQERVGHADRPQPRPPAPDDQRDERRPGAVQRRHRGHGVVVEQAGQRARGRRSRAGTGARARGCARAAR